MVKLDTKMTRDNLVKYQALLRMMSTDETRFFLQYLHVETIDDTSYVTATDGRRMGIIKNEIDLEPGFYEIVKSNRKELWIEKADIKAKFPNWKGILDDCIKSNTDLIGEYTFKSNLFDLTAPVFDIVKAGKKINLAFLADLKGLELKVFKNPDEKEHAVLFQNGNFQAVIMAMEPY